MRFECKALCLLPEDKKDAELFALHVDLTLMGVNALETTEYRLFVHVKNESL